MRVDMTVTEMRDFIITNDLSDFKDRLLDVTFEKLIVDCFMANVDAIMVMPCDFGKCTSVIAKKMNTETYESRTYYDLDFEISWSEFLTMLAK